MNKEEFLERRYLMVLCRCLKNHSPPKSKEYMAYVKPIGYPETSSICGRKDCDNQGMIWLKKSEVDDYNRGQRIFKVTFVVKMKADDDGVQK